MEQKENLLISLRKNESEPTKKLVFTLDFYTDKPPFPNEKIISLCYLQNTKSIKNVIAAYNGSAFFIYLQNVAPFLSKKGIYARLEVSPESEVQVPISEAVYSLGSLTYKHYLVIPKLPPIIRNDESAILWKNYHATLIQPIQGFKNNPPEFVDTLSGTLITPPINGLAYKRKGVPYSFWSYTSNQEVVNEYKDYVKTLAII